jgi:hypothetical protein
MTFPHQAIVKKWALRSAAFLFASAVILFIAFCVLSYREEVKAFHLGEPYDSITSSYLGLVVVAIFAAIGATLATAIYFGTTLAGRLIRHTNDRNA